MYQFMSFSERNQVLKKVAKHLYFDEKNLDETHSSYHYETELSTEEYRVNC